MKLLITNKAVTCSIILIVIFFFLVRGIRSLNGGRSFYFKYFATLLELYDMLS